MSRKLKRLSKTKSGAKETVETKNGEGIRGLPTLWFLDWVENPEKQFFFFVNDEYGGHLLKWYLDFMTDKARWNNKYLGIMKDHLTVCEIFVNYLFNDRFPGGLKLQSLEQMTADMIESFVETVKIEGVPPATEESKQAVRLTIALLLYSICAERERDRSLPQMTVTTDGMYEFLKRCLPNECRVVRQGEILFFESTSLS